MIENWEFCNLLGIFRRIGFKARFVNCREAAYLNKALHLATRASAIYESYSANWGACVTNGDVRKKVNK